MWNINYLFLFRFYRHNQRRVLSNFTRGKNFPSNRALNSTNNKAAILQELRKCQGQLYDETNAMSINTVEFSYTDATCTPSISKYSGLFLIVGISKYSGLFRPRGQTTTKCEVFMFRFVPIFH